MSLSQHFSIQAQTVYETAIEQTCQRIAHALPDDLETIKLASTPQEQAGSKNRLSFLGLKDTPRSLLGDFDKAAFALTYTLIDTATEKSDAYETRQKMKKLIIEMIDTALKKSDALHTLHTVCARADIDMRIDVKTKDEFVPNGFDTPYQRIITKIVIHLREPYKNSPKKRTSPPAPPRLSRAEVEQHIAALSDEDAQVVMKNLMHRCGVAAVADRTTLSLLESVTIAVPPRGQGRKAP